MGQHVLVMLHIKDYLYFYIHQIHLLPIKYYTIHTGTCNGLGTGLDGHLMKSTIDTESIKNRHI